MKSEIATFAAGCFWGVEETFRKTPGVKETMVGYIGGKRPNPSYEQVCSSATGHAEAVQVEFDPEEISYGKLLDIFWSCHNPTTPDRQGPDVGSQYRSAIFTHSDEQKRQAMASMAELEKSGKFNNPIVTEIVDAPEFYAAEDYHQKYLMKRGEESCHI